MVAAYIVTAVILLAYAFSLYRRIGKDERGPGRVPGVSSDERSR